MPKTNWGEWDSQIYHAADALAPRPPKQYSVESIFVLPSLNIVYGLPGSHKTNAMIDLACCVGLGKIWLQGNQDFAGFNVKKSHILWIDSDSGRDALHERFGAMLRAHAGNPIAARTAQISYMSFPNPPFSARNNDAVNEVIRRAVEMEIKLIVFDNLGTISGGADENSYEMISVMNNLRLITERVNATVIVIHHDTKHPAPRKAPRGHSSIEAAINLSLWVDRQDDAITFTPTKQRDNPFDPFMAVFDYSHKADGETLDCARFIGVEFFTDPATAKIQKLITEFLSKNGHQGNQQELIKLCAGFKIPKMRVISEIRRMTKRNLIVVKAGQAHNQHIYTLPKGKE